MTAKRQWQLDIPDDGNESLIELAGGWDAATEHAGDWAYWSEVELHSLHSLPSLHSLELSFVHASS